MEKVTRIFNNSEGGQDYSQKGSPYVKVNVFTEQRPDGLRASCWCEEKDLPQPGDYIEIKQNGKYFNIKKASGPNTVNPSPQSRANGSTGGKVKDKTTMYESFAKDNINKMMDKWDKLPSDYDIIKKIIYYAKFYQDTDKMGIDAMYNKLYKVSTPEEPQEPETTPIPDDDIPF